MLFGQELNQNQIDMNCKKNQAITTFIHGMQTINRHSHAIQKHGNNHLRDTVCPGYKWEDYYHDLFHGGKLWDAVRIAFRGAIQRLDFKPDWLEVGFNEL